MLVTQVAQIANEALSQSVGEHAVLEQDLSNIIDVGRETVYASDGNLDNFVKALPDACAKMYFMNEKYEGLNLSIMVDAWEYGAILARHTVEGPSAVVNEAWQLENGQSYDPNIFYGTTVSSKYFSKYGCFDIDVSVAKDQAKSAFHSAEELNAFISAIFIEVENAIVQMLDDLSLLTVDLLIASVLDDENTVTAVNVLAGYNALHADEPLTTDTCLTSKAFLEYLAEVTGNYAKKLTRMSVLYNVAGQKTFTKKERLKFFLLDELTKKLDVYLNSSTYHDELVKLPGYESVPFWQGQGTDDSFESRSTINVKNTEAGIDIEKSGILGVMFDNRACMIMNDRRETDVNYNGKARFYNYFYHIFLGRLVDTNYNAIVFYIEDEDDEEDGQ